MTTITAAAQSLPLSTAIGTWQGNTERSPLMDALQRVRTPLFILDTPDGPVAATNGEARISVSGPGEPLLAYVPAANPEQLGDPAFCSDYGIRYPLIGGSMAKGISSADLVIALGKAGMLGFFGAAGLTPERVEQAIDRIEQALGDLPFGCNLIHSPNEPGLEDRIVDLYLRRSIRLVEASAFLDLSLPLVRYRTAGISRLADGTIHTPNRVIGKVSREEVAAKFFAPPPAKMLEKLVADGHLTAAQAELAAQIPVAQEVTAEADSGGHTDNRPAISLFPTIVGVRDQAQMKYGYPCSLRVGLGGGIATPVSAAAAFAMGAAYLVTGTVNQACVESGTSDMVRQMLAEARQADIALAPAADMFEMGVTVQVLKRGTMFSMRGAKLYETYKSYPSLEAIPAPKREKLEKTILRESIDTIWQSTREFFTRRDPSQIERAERDPKYRMALVFRWYLGMATHWANDGLADRKIDFQIWCGPAMGAFNEWTAGTFLAAVENRQVETVSLNLLHGAACLNRMQSLKTQGVDISALPRITPLPLATIKEFLL